MKQFIWVLFAAAGTLVSASARETITPITLATDDGQHLEAQNWHEVTGLPGQLPERWQFIETDLSSIWLLKNLDDPNLLGRISTQSLDEGIQLKDEVDSIADSFKLQSVNITRRTETYGNIDTEQLEVSTKDGEQDVAGIFVFMNYQGKIYTILLTNHSSISKLQQQRHQLMNNILVEKSPPSGA
ncbi:hypothetical protein LPW36_13650 [Jinshanibacter sp. LJY008]|uniref:DUF1795 domain-containing protein n=1 Tax=Limnobaculum eriocheiris TaxID=2897391 RepID=A0A9X1SLN4_9GAMM|nr:hypothetical protein [Limnobaculum eriocheiris]MCD1127025.1 hypothetical protein [Limnobaculum eriocheiris]